jgi:hypothetical protein
MRPGVPGLHELIMLKKSSPETGLLGPRTFVAFVLFSAGVCLDKIGNLPEFLAL